MPLQQLFSTAKLPATQEVQTSAIPNTKRHRESVKKSALQYFYPWRDSKPANYLPIVALIDQQFYCWRVKQIR